MKNISKRIFSLVLLVLIFASCNKEVDKNNEISSSNIQSVGEREELIASYPPSIKIDGITYQDTGMINSGVTCGTVSGKVTSTVESSKLPEKDGQSNFGKGYEYQTWDENYINVKIDNQWVLFRNIDSKKIDIPKGVANFDGIVKEVSNDNILISITKLDKDYKYIFENKDTSEIKPISIDINNAIFDKNIMDMGVKNLKGKNIKVYFDGQVKNLEKEKSDPVEIGEIYKISLVDK